MDCPRCRVTMQEVTIVDVPVDLCPECDGTWYDAGELSELLDLPAEELLGSPLAAALVADKPEGTELELPCPRCGLVMERFHYMQKSPVVVDGCAEHGLWLDDGELPKILEFLALTAPPPEPGPAQPAPRRGLVRTLLGLFYRFEA